MPAMYLYDYDLTRFGLIIKQSTNERFLPSGTGEGLTQLGANRAAMKRKSKPLDSILSS